MKAHLLPALRALLFRMARAFTDPRPRPKVLDLALGWLCGPLPKTVTSALDWLDLDSLKKWNIDVHQYIERGKRWL